MANQLNATDISRVDAIVQAANAKGVDVFDGGGEMGALMRATDWSQTRLGPIETWPRSLKTMLGVVLGSRFPMLLWWGPELLHLYNDAYRPILRDKHPTSLAAPAAYVWSEVWDVAGPMAQSVQEGGPATWTEDLQLFINNAGIAEETYFTFSYSPVPNDNGEIGGLLNTVQETTVKVQSERQIRMLHDLAAGSVAVRTEEQAYQLVMEVLSGNALDLPFVLLYRCNQNVDAVQLVGANGWPAFADALHADPMLLSGDHRVGFWPLTEVWQNVQESVVNDLSSRFDSVPTGRWNARPEQAIVLPLFRAGQPTPNAFLIAGVSPHRALDERYQRFFRATADQVMTVIANALAHETEKRRVQALADLDRAKSAFFSNVSHEFRTPLTLMLGPIADALASDGESLSGEALKMVHRNALRLTKLVNTLLDFSKLEAQRMEACFEATDLAALTIDLVSTFRSAIERHGLNLVVDCPHLPEPIYVDHDMWEKIILNLLSNALKFTFEGSIALALQWHGDHVQAQVCDTGIGIASSELPRLFERFHRVQGAKSRTHEGSGIGLALVHELVTLHGGTIDAKSELGKGTAFTIAIPAGSRHLPPDCVQARILNQSAANGAAAFVQEAQRWSIDQPLNDPSSAVRDWIVPSDKQGKPRVLVVDDNADLRNYVSGLLSDHYAVDTAGDGLVALALIKQCEPDLVLSDVMMPRLDGVELLRALRGNAATQEVPVILLSARADEASTVKSFDEGANDYLAKPFSARELLARVRTHLELARLRRERARDLEEANRHKQERIDHQEEMIRELSTPILDVRHRLLLMPIVGSIHANRARLINDTLLLAIRRHRAAVVVMDITGVPLVDAEVATYLIASIKASRLLGAELFLSGISCDVARFFADWNESLPYVKTYASLRVALAAAESAVLARSI